MPTIEIAEDQLLELRFMGEHIGLIDYEGVRFVSLRHVCENLGLDPPGQFKKVHSNPKYTPMGICLRVPLQSAGGAAMP